MSPMAEQAEQIEQMVSEDAAVTRSRPDGARPGTDPDLVSAAQVQPHVRLFFVACIVGAVLPFVFSYVPGGPAAWVAALVVVGVMIGLFWAALRLPRVSHIPHYGGKLMGLVAVWAVVWTAAVVLVLTIPNWNYLKLPLLIVAAVAFLILGFGAFALERDRVKRARRALEAAQG